MPVQQTKSASSKKTPAKTKAAVRVSNQVKLDPDRPIPFEQSGRSFYSVTGTRYLPFLPPNDDYAIQLLEARLLSSTHNACITTKKDYCAGVGFQDKDGNELDSGIVDWFKSMNLKNEPATEINKQVFEGFFTHGNQPIELVRYSVAGKRYFFVYAHNFLEWKLGPPNDDDIVTYAIQSKLFLRQGIVSADEIKKAKKLPIYNPRQPDKKNWFKDDKGVERTLIWYKNSVTGFPYYGLPSAISSMIYQVLEYKGARFNLDNFDNNMIVSAILALKGNLTQPEADKIGRKILSTHTGDGKRGRVMVVASEEGIENSELHNLDTHKEGSYNEADEKWSQKIILANQWDAILAGLVNPSTMGKGAGFIRVILENKLNTVIKPAQVDVVTKVWATIFRLCQDYLELPFDKYNLEIKNAIDISGLTDVDITPAVTVDEVREAKGLPKAQGEMGSKFLGELKGQQQMQKGGGDV